MAGLRDDYPVPQQLQFFTRSQVAEMRDRTASRNYSAERDEFRREHERHRAWGVNRRHAEKLRRARESSRAAQQAPAVGDRPRPEPPSRGREARPALGRHLPAAQGHTSHADRRCPPEQPAQARRSVGQESPPGPTRVDSERRGPAPAPRQAAAASPTSERVDRRRPIHTSQKGRKPVLPQPRRRVGGREWPLHSQMERTNAAMPRFSGYPNSIPRVPP